MTALLVVLTAVVLVLCVLVAGLLQAYAAVLRRLHRLEDRTPAEPPPFNTAGNVVAPRASTPAVTDAGPADAPSGAPVGSDAEWPPAHDIAGETVGGEIATVRTVDVAHDTFLFFLSSGCTGCARFWADLERPELTDRLGGRVVAVTKDAAEESISALQSQAPAGLDVLMSSAAWTDYRVPGSPYVVLVDGATGRVRGEGSGTSLEQIAGLLGQARGDGAEADRRGRGRKPRADTEREADVDRALLAAGITPGHPSLYAGPDRAPGADGRELLDLSPASRRPAHQDRVDR